MSTKDSPTIDLVAAITVAAAGAIAQCRGVGFDGLQIAVAGKKGIGIAKHDAESGESVAVKIAGSAICEAGGVFSKGDALVFDSQGRVVAASTLAPTIGTLAATKGTLVVDAGATPVTSTGANGDLLAGEPALTGVPGIAGSVPPESIIGDALEASTGAGKFVEVLLRR